MADMMINAALIDWILGLVALEALAILGWRIMTSRGPQPLGVISNVVAGAFLLIALRGAVSGAAPAWIGACIFASFLAHFVDLAARWGDGRRNVSTDPAQPNIRATLSLRASPNRIRPAPPAPKDEAANG
jgi:hypothetical protein